MPQDTAEQRAGLSKLLASGVVRLARQTRVSKGQAAVLALCLVGAVVLGILLQPRRQEDAPPAITATSPEKSPDASRGVERVDVAGAEDGAALAKAGATEVPAGAAPVSPGRSDAAGTADIATNAALDRLAAEIVKINKRLDEVVSSERETSGRVAALGAAGAATIASSASAPPPVREPSSQRAVQPPPSTTARANASQRHITLSVQRTPDRVLVRAPAPPSPRLVVAQQAAERMERRRRLLRRARLERRRYAGFRTIFGARLPF